MTPSMLDTAELYDVARNLTIDRICVDDERFQSFSLAVRDLQRSLATEGSDTYWRPVLARLRRIRWELATVPLPFSHPVFELAASDMFLRESLRDCDRVFPAHASSAQRITDLLAALVSRTDDPLGDSVRELSVSGRDGALLLRDARYASAVEVGLARPLGITILTPSQLPGSRVFDVAAIIGPTCWYPNSVFGAPKAKEMHIVHFRWISDTQLDTAIFAGPQVGGRTRGVSLPEYRGRGAREGTLGSSELVPVTDWAAIAARTGGTTERTQGRPDSVDAYLFLLASEQVVYLEAEEGSRAYVVELGASKELLMVPTRSIQSGTYLVNRVGGEGDYIPAIADSLLGDEAPRLRAAQQRWKKRLGEAIRSDGVPGVLSRLISTGAPRASRANLRRWASDNSIRTEDYADFEGLMEVIGLGEEASQLWRDMDLIAQAHLRAGQRVRQLLVREILDGDTRELETRGWQNYDVEEIEGEGALQVARVEARHPETVRVSARETRRLLAVERDLWQG